MRYSLIWPIFAKQWDAMKILPKREAEFRKDAEFALAHKDQYQAIEQATGVPWALVAVLHRRESNADFSTYLGNGQSLARKTTIVPKGRGPFPGPNAFIDGAVDSLKLDGLTDVKDWRLEKELYYCEQFNGWGYGMKPSPYVWGGTSVQLIGKFARDHYFDPHLWDPQPGCAPLLATIAQLDPTVTFTRES